MPERRNWSLLDHRDARGCRHPPLVARPWKLGAPAKPAGNRRKPVFEFVAHSVLRADPAEQHNFSAGAQNAQKFVQPRFWIGYGSDDILSHHNIKRAAWKFETLRIHHRKAFDVFKPPSSKAHARHLKHRF